MANGGHLGWIVVHPETILTEAWTDYPRSVAKGLSIRDDHCPPSGNRPYFNVYACSAGDPRSPIQRSTTDTRWQPRMHRILLYILANLLEFTLAPRTRWS